MTDQEQLIEQAAQAMYTKGETDTLGWGALDLGMEIYLGLARALAAAGKLADPSRMLGEDQCCPDTCEGGGCQACLGCAAGWCVNGHDFIPGEWDGLLTDEDRECWWTVAREHNQGIDAALRRAEKAEQELAAIRSRAQSELIEDRDGAPLPDDVQQVFAYLKEQAATPADPQAAARVAEYLRQYALARGLHPSLIHGVWSDPQAESAQLTVEDLRSLI